MSTRQEGMSLIELMIAMALLLALTAGVVTTLSRMQSAVPFEPEAADQQQRLRVAADTLFGGLAGAGAGPSRGGSSGALLFAIAPVLPFRIGGSASDPPGTFASERVSLISVAAAAPWSTLAVDLTPGATMLQAERQTRCAAGLSLCGFTAGSTLLVYDEAGSFDIFTLLSVDTASGQLQIASRPGSSAASSFRSGSVVVEARVDVYALKVDAAGDTTQLVHGDGTTNPDTPVVDHIVGLAFDYFGEPRAPALIEGTAEFPGLRTTYGLTPPPLGSATTMYPPGENCVFRVDATGTAQVPRLGDLGADGSLVHLTAAQLTDGPWCPDTIRANRWDADLLRIRSVVVTVRVESALAALRGPAGALFANGGISRNPSRWMPDVERRFAVAPSNMNVAR